MSDSMQGLFLRAHAALHPEGEAMRELLASGVSERRVINLYPYELRDWLPALILQAQGRESKPEERPDPYVLYWRNVGVKDIELHARMRGIEEESRRLPGREWTAWIQDEADACLEVLSTAEGASWVDAMGFICADQSALTSLAATIAVLDELVATASRWSELPNLHPHDAEWRPYIEASLAVLLPSEFQLDRPPVRYDTMMNR